MTDPTPPHWRAPSGACPHCATASLAAAWQAGVEKTCEKMQARIEALEAERDKMRKVMSRLANVLGAREVDDETLVAWAEKQAIAAIKGEGE